MIVVRVSDTSRRYGEQVVDERTETPRTLFEKLGVAYRRAQTSLNGRILSDEEMDSSFETLGITQMGFLNSIVKGDGAFQF